jgi:hypothetical protein
MTREQLDGAEKPVSGDEWNLIPPGIFFAKSP